MTFTNATRIEKPYSKSATITKFHKARGTLCDHIFQNKCWTYSYRKRNRNLDYLILSSELRSLSISEHVVYANISNKLLSGLQPLTHRVSTGCEQDRLFQGKLYRFPLPVYLYCRRQ